MGRAVRLRLRQRAGCLDAGSSVTVSASAGSVAGSVVFVVGRVLVVLVGLVVLVVVDHVVVVLVFVVVVLVVLVELLLSVERASSSGQRPPDGAPRRTSGRLAGSSSGWPGAMTPEQDEQRRDDDQDRHDLGDRHAEERPVVDAERLEHEPDDPVPDEEEEQQVARAQPLAQVEAEPDRTTRRGRPEIDSYRKSGWKRVAVSGNSAGQGYAATRWAQSIGIPHGSVVGGPYSSWLKKLPQRAMACIVNSPGATMSAQRRNGAFL